MRWLRAFHLFPLVSLFLKQHEPPKIILSNIVPSQQVRFIPGKEIHLAITNRPDNPIPMPTIRLDDIYHQIDHQNVIPLYHPQPKIHFYYYYQRYARSLAYNEFCLLEEKMADIMVQLVQDPRPIIYVIYFEDPLWLNDGLLRPYMTKEENNKIITYHYINLDEPIDGIVCRNHKNRFLWDHYHHPTI